MKKVLAAVLSLCMMLLVFVPAYAADENTQTQLKFNDDGEFKIIQFADTQDDVFPSKAMLTLMEKVCEELKPDLVVFSGDNVSQAIAPLNRAAIRQLIAPIAKLGIPYAYTFGNHDAENDVSKQTQHKYYMENGNCLTYNADDSLHGFGNCNLPILSSDGEDIAFNLWMIDSNMYHPDGGYDIVYPDQMEWYETTSIALEEQAGHKVPSLVFQHIVPPEIFDYLEPAPEGTTESTKYHTGRDGSFLMRFKADAPVNGGFFLQEFPCPTNFNTNEVEVMAQRGDVLGIAFGHDHVNNYIVSMENGIDLIQTPGMSYQSYGNDNVRGFRMFTLNENDPWSYETQTYKYTDFMSASEINNFSANLYQYFMSVMTIFDVAFKSILSYLPGGRK
ncbi:MAG: metallophosphoesterase family protein [Oscillospiraceae bacterium]|jgi:hypothetical protein|nr:metallophosphoesterase family protein [Oscillospiraceae bacterium]